ncbi:MAG: hypothetical protein ACR2I0_12250, partial [Rhodoferax sp.]
MATKDERLTLLSKVAKFVRNPTKDWSELDRPDPEEGGGYDKQALKAMIERKRQNDFVRRREFDQLRKLRNRGDAAQPDEFARPSLFQASSEIDAGGREVTLKKIDEIEAQMSKQWWNNRQQPGGAEGAGLGRQAHRDAVSTTQPPEPSTIAPDSAFELTATADQNADSALQEGNEFAPTEMVGGLDRVASSLNDSGASRAAAKAPMDFSSSDLFAVEGADLRTDPELEEAAIRFANGDDSGAENGLLQALRGEAIEPEVALTWVAALLDLYRATNDPVQFESALLEFDIRFERAKPVWAAIGDRSAPAPVARLPSARRASAAVWESPKELTDQAMEGLRDAMSMHAPPWHIDWSQLVSIT